MSFSDSLAKEKSNVKIWQTVCFVQSVAVIVLGITTAIATFQLVSGLKNERIILTPAVLGRSSVERGSYVSNDYIRAVSNQVVGLQEQWTYESIESNYSELFKLYFDHRLTELTKANLISTDRFRHVKKNQMTSTFRIDQSRSAYDWCEKLGRPCSLVVGTRKIFIDNNNPYSERQVSYLIIGSDTYPSQTRPFAVQITRMIVDDQSDDPYSTMHKQLEAAKKGELPNE